MHHHARRLAIGLLVSVASLHAHAGAGSQAHIPQAWLHKLQNVPFDANHNFVDDTLEALPGTSHVDVLVDLTGCLATADRARLVTYGSIDFESAYVPTIYISNVLVSTLPALGADPSVAFVEEDEWMYHTLEKSSGAIQVKGSTAYPPPTPPQPPITVREKYPTLTGNSTMAIFDTGVRDQAQPNGHQALPQFARGLTCPPLAGACTEGNPDDMAGTGTHGAGIAIGQGEGYPSSPHEGIAPNENMYDIQVQPDLAALPVIRILKSQLAKAIDALLVRATRDFDPWTTSVAYIPWSTCSPDVGNMGISVAIDQLAAHDIFVVTGMGKCAQCIGKPKNPCVSCPCQFVPGPAAADGAFVVGAVDDQNTELRTDDALPAIERLFGPRADGTIKPDLVAPGINIESADYNTQNGYINMSGASAAAAHVAGCAALIRQIRFATPAELKEIFRQTADPHGQVVPNNNWGYGELNCFAAVDKLNAGTCADLTFEGGCGGPGLPPCFDHPALHSKEWLVEGIEAKIQATIHNNGPGFSDLGKVALKMDYFSNGDNGFLICAPGVTLPTLAPGASTTVECSWTPDIKGTPPGVVHACIRGLTISANDCFPDNNYAQHNEDIQQSRSPAVSRMDVENPTYELLTMELQGTFDCGGGAPCPGWSFSTSANFFQMAAGDCATTVSLIATPAANAVRKATIHVATIGHGAQTYDLGGVTMTAWLACPTRNLLFTTKDTFTWSGPTGVPSTCFSGGFDVARGPIPIPKYPSTTVRGDFGSAACLASDAGPTTFTDTTNPTPGTGFYYLTRVGGPTPGSWDVADPRQKGLADDTLKSCP